jgi:hypothetical protein
MVFLAGFGRDMVQGTLGADEVVEGRELSQAGQVSCRWAPGLELTWRFQGLRALELAGCGSGEDFFLELLGQAHGVGERFDWLSKGISHGNYLQFLVHSLYSITGNRWYRLQKMALFRILLLQCGGYSSNPTKLHPI